MGYKCACSDKDFQSKAAVIEHMNEVHNSFYKEDGWKPDQEKVLSKKGKTKAEIDTLLEG